MSNSHRRGRSGPRIAPARGAAYEVLLAVSSGQADLPDAIAARAHALADARDRALALEISTGVERWRATIDHLIEHFARRHVARLDLEVLVILRLSVYQLLYLTRVPASAVVDDAVDLTRRAGKQSAASFVNAVLRTLARSRHRLPLPARPDPGASRDAIVNYLSIALSHPQWLATRWLDRYGFDVAERWMQFNNTAASLTLRANTRVIDRDSLAARLAEDDVQTRPGRFAPDALVVERGAAFETKGLEEGWFVVQDEASQLVALLAGADPGVRVLDACASPGNKATAVAATTSGLVIASDVRRRRMALLATTVARTRTPNIRLVQADLTRPLPFFDRFDTVVVDAPCSGLGTLRRDPDIRWRRREDDLRVLATSALQMLRHAAAVVRPGGRLVYATCSSEPEENDEVVNVFLNHAREFARVDARSAHPALPASVVDEQGYLRTSPDRHGLEAFFGAVLMRQA